MSRAKATGLVLLAVAAVLNAATMLTILFPQS